MIQRIEPKATNSRAVIYDDLIFFSGHVAAGKQETMKEQAKALLMRYDELFNQYSTDKNHIISAVVYITDMEFKAEFNEIWKSWMNPEHAPSRVCVEVGLDEGYLIEISLVAKIIN